MRLASFKIGSEKPGDKQRFKNLKNVCIDFDENEWITVVICLKRWQRFFAT
jgi:hypothetical protein